MISPLGRKSTNMHPSVSQKTLPVSLSAENNTVVTLFVLEMTCVAIPYSVEIVEPVLFASPVDYGPRQHLVEAAAFFFFYILP